MFRRALDLGEKALRTGHLDVLNCRQGLISAVINLGRYEEAEQSGRRALDLGEEIYGKGHGSTLVQISSLVLVLGRQRKCEEAMEMNRRPLSLLNELFREDHPRIIRNANNERGCHTFWHYTAAGKKQGILSLYLVVLAHWIWEPSLSVSQSVIHHSLCR